MRRWSGHDLRGLLRGAEAVSDTQIAGAIAEVWSGRTDRYSQLRGSGQAPSGERRVEMHYIGG